MSMKRSLWMWLSNPFQFVAGWSALGAGALLMVASGALAWLGQAHFDGVLDFHTGAGGPLWLNLAEPFINWLSVAVLLLPAALLLSRSKVRPIDILGTLALARAPMGLAAAAALMPGMRRYLDGVMAALGPVMSGDAPGTDLLMPPGVSVLDLASAVLGLLATLLALVWTLVWMYRAFAVSANIGGFKTVTAYIIAILAAEVLSKVAIVVLAGYAAPAVDDAAVDFVRTVAAGEYVQAVERFDGTMQAAMPAKALEGHWEELTNELGAFESAEYERTQHLGTFSAVFVRCQFENGTATLKVVYSLNGKISGLWVDQ